MNLKSKLITIVIATALYVPNVQADPNTVLANICTLIKNNDSSQLRSKVKTMKKDYGASLKDYYDGITCGGLTMIRYAIQNGSVDSGEYLIKKMSKKALREPQKDSITELDWANANGHDGSPIVAALIARIG